VYDKALHDKISKVITSAGDEPVYRHAGESSCLQVITSRNDIGQNLLGKKIPQKSFRLLWIDDEGYFARFGRMDDTAYESAFVVTAELRIKEEEFEKIQQAYVLDRFISACQFAPTLKTRHSIEYDAANYAASYEMFQSSEISRYSNNGYLRIMVSYPLQNSYEAASPGAWIVGLLGRTREYESSFGTYFAVDTNDWWSHNKLGIVSEVDDSLCTDLVARFRVNGVEGFISARDAIVDGRSVEE
jgi:hypothetical protein